MSSPHPAPKNSHHSNLQTRPRVFWNRTYHLIQRAYATFHEGGVSLVVRRLRRWIQHRYSRLFPSHAYQRWIEENSPTDKELRQQREWANTTPEKLLISIVCPVYRTPVNILKETIQSVLNQTYPYWELCLTLCDDESPELKNVISQFANEDRRIHIVGLEKNRGISENTNSALEEVQGTWISFLDHDDLLAPNALYAVAKHITDQPNCDLVYSDEDLLSSTGRFRRSPNFKPAWSPEMLVHFNYICHFVAVRRDVLQRVGGLRSEVDGAQDWDLLLRISEQTQRIHHIPKVLYHWRELSTSTAGQLDTKPYVVSAQKKVVQDTLRRRGISAQVDVLRNGHVHPCWELSKSPLVSVIIPNRDQPHLIRQVVTGILEDTDYPNVHIVIVDNQSTHPDVLAYYASLKQRNQATVVNYPHPFNYSAACNRGAKAALGDYLLFLNNDIEITKKDWLKELVKWALDPGVGMVGPHLLYPNGRTQHAGLVLGLFGLVGHNYYQCSREADSPFGSAEWVRNVTAVTGACQLVSRQLFNQLDGYDEDYRLLYSDVDLCLRIRQQGSRIVYTPHSQLIHHEAATRKSRKEDEKDAQRFAELLAKLEIQVDPYYNSSLSARSTIPQLRFKPELNTAENLQVEISKYVGRDDSQPITRRAA